MGIIKEIVLSNASMRGDFYRPSEKEMKRFLSQSYDHKQGYYYEGIQVED